MQRLDTTPLAVGNRSLTRGLAVIGVLTPLYDQSSWTYLDRALTLADDGNGSVLLSLADLYLGRNADGTYNNAGDANYAVNCLYRPVPSDPPASPPLGPAFPKPSPLFSPST